jgi:hypothetical protein
MLDSEHGRKSPFGSILLGVGHPRRGLVMDGGPKGGVGQLSAHAKLVLVTVMPHSLTLAKVAWGGRGV